MSTLRISAKSIDEVNYVYKRIKKDYEAIGAIKLNQDSMEYELFLERNRLDGSLAAICDKVIDMDDLLDEESVFTDFSWNRLVNILSSEKDVPKQLNSLQKVWSDLSSDKKWGCYKYLCEEMEIELAEGEEVMEKY